MKIKIKQKLFYSYLNLQSYLRMLFLIYKHLFSFRITCIFLYVISSYHSLNYNLQQIIVI